MILPPPGDGFEWRDVEARPVLVCRPLEGRAAHLFTTSLWRLGRRGVDPDDEGWLEIANAMQVAVEGLTRARQVHGASVAMGRQPQGTLPEADALVARDASLVLAIQVADCVPVLIADARTGAVAAVHAGWRGLASGVLSAAVDTLERQYGSRCEDLMTALGPSIGPCCYQVGDDVRARFTASHGHASVARWFLDAPAAIDGNPSMRGLDAAPRSDRWFFDAWSCAADQLAAAGIAPYSVFNARLCTASHADLLCSYRRDGRGAGRLAAAIVGKAGPGSHRA